MDTKGGNLQYKGAQGIPGIKTKPLTLEPPKPKKGFWKKVFSFIKSVLIHA